MNETTNKIIERLLEIKGIDEHEFAKRLKIPYVRWKTYKGQHFEYCSSAFIAHMCYQLGVPVNFIESVGRYQYFEVKF